MKLRVRRIDVGVIIGLGVIILGASWGLHAWRERATTRVSAQRLEQSIRQSQDPNMNGGCPYAHEVADGVQLWRHPRPQHRIDAGVDH